LLLKGSGSAALLWRALGSVNDPLVVRQQDARALSRIEVGMDTTPGNELLGAVHSVPSAGDPTVYLATHAITSDLLAGSAVTAPHFDYGADKANHFLGHIVKTAITDIDEDVLERAFVAGVDVP
jgi:hypothetical protein